MSKSLRALALTTALAACAALGVSAQADARPPTAAPATGESACPYKYVVTDGKSDNVVTYKSGRSKARQGSIHPNERFVVFVGSKGGAPDHVASRQRTDHGWVNFPHNYLQANGRCVAISQQSLQDTSQTLQDLSGAAGQAVRDVGRSLRDAARSAR